MGGTPSGKSMGIKNRHPRKDGIMESEKNTCCYTAQELAAYAKDRRFDQVIVVTSDVREKVKNITEIYELKKWMAQPDYASAYHGICASAWMEDVELKLIQPDDTANIWNTFLKKYGDGICCIREGIRPEDWEDEKNAWKGWACLSALNLQTRQGRPLFMTYWINLGGTWPFTWTGQTGSSPGKNSATAEN